MVDRVPPHNLEAEESLLGAMLLSRDAIGAGVEAVTADDFYGPAHGHIFAAIATMYAQGEAVDPVTVSDALKRAGLLDAVGGSAALVRIQAGTPSTTGASRYARIIEDLAALRRLIGAAAEIAELGYGSPDDVPKTIELAESMVYQVSQRRTTDNVVSVEAVLGETLDQIEERYTNGGKFNGLSTGFTELDNILSGLQPSNLIVVGARPAMGKTSYATGVATHVAFEVKRPVLLFSLEMSRIELAHRLLAADSRVDATKLRTGNLTTDDWRRLAGSVGRFADAPLFIDDDPSLTISTLRAKARRLQSRLGDLGLIIVDYVQLMNARSRENRQVEVSELSRSLKILARELETPVMALAQLNRGLEQRADKRPMLSDLRESGSLEQDSDVVLFIYRDEVYNPESSDRGTAELIVAKHRSGPTGIARLAWLDHCTKFANMARV